MKKVLVLGASGYVGAQLLPCYWMRDTTPRLLLVILRL